MFVSRTRKLLVKSALPDFETYHRDRATWFCNLSFQTKKTFCRCLCNQTIWRLWKWLFWFLFISGGKTTKQKGKNIFLTFLEKWLRNAKTLEWGFKVVGLKWQTPIGDRQTIGRDRQTISHLKNRLVTNKNIVVFFFLCKSTSRLFRMDSESFGQWNVFI